MDERKRKAKGAVNPNDTYLPKGKGSRGTYKSARRDLFIDSVVEFGFVNAIKLTGYNSITGKRLLRNEWVKREIMARIKQELADLGITKKDLLNEYLDFTKQASSENVKNNAYQWLLDSAEENNTSESDRFYLPAFKVNGRLEPSQAVMIPENSGLDRSKDVEIVSEGANKDSG